MALMIAAFFPRGGVVLSLAATSPSLPPSPFPASSTRALVASGNTIWAATDSGVLRWNRGDNTSTQYTIADGLAGDSINAIAVDNRGRIWVGGPRSVVGTGAGGVSEFDGRTWRSHTPADGLISDQVRAIGFDRTGRTWVATAEEIGLGGGVSTFDGTRWTSYTVDDGLASNKVLSLAIDQSDWPWFGTTAGVSRFDGQSWTTYTTADGLAHNQVNAIAVDSTGRLWFGTAGGGVSLFDGQSWTTNTAADGLASNMVYALAVDQAGHLWAGTSGGLSVLDGARWLSYTRRDGLPFGHIQALAIDEAGHKWLGGGQSGAGIVEFDERGWAASPPALPAFVITPAINPPAAVEITGPHLTDDQAGRSYARGRVEGIEKTLVLASADEHLLATYNLVGELALDSPRHRLYIDQGQAGLAVVNTQTERLGNLIFLPDIPLHASVAAPQVDPTSGRVLAFRDNVAYIMDPATGSIMDTITSGFSEVVTCWGGPGLGVPAISKTTYDPANRILYLAAQTFSCNSSLGGNTGFTIESYQLPSGAKIAEAGGSYSGAGTVLGRYFYLGDVSTPAGWHNGIRSVWRDGRPWVSSGGWAEVGETLGFDAKRGRFYEVTSNSLRVFDAQTMALRLHLPRPLAGNFAGYDAAADQLRFRDNDRVQTWPVRAIQAPAPEPLTNRPLPDTPVTFLAVSPNWVEDQTLFGLWSDPNPPYECNSPSLNEGSFFLSADGGQTWGQSWGGLRGSCELLTTLAVSPNYARDQTLFAGVAGLGIFTSSDGGRLWQPASAGLDHMGIGQILPSPDFPADQTIFAQAGYWHRSRDRGQTWQSLNEVLPGQPGCPGMVALSPEFATDRTVACTAFNQSLEQTELYLSRDGGDRWEQIGPTPAGIDVQMLSLAPLFAKWQTLFIHGTDSMDMTKNALYRSSDGGRNWAQVLSPELSFDAYATVRVTPSLVYAPASEANRPIFLLVGETIYQSKDGGQTWQTLQFTKGVKPSALAISPNFAQDRTLFIGTANGQVLILEVTE